MLGALIFSGAAFAQSQYKMSDEMIPPDVTLTDKVTTNAAISPGNTNAPGLTGQTPSGQPNAEIPAFTGNKPGFSGVGGPKNPFNNNQFAGQMDQLIKSGGNKVDAQKLMELQQQMQQMGMPHTQDGQPKNPTHYSMSQNQNQGQGQNAQVQPGQPIGQGSQSKDPVAVIETSKGTIVIRMFRGFAPKTVQAFSQMAGEGFYNGLNFHRVEPGFVVQGGCPKGNGTGLYLDRNSGKPRMLPLEVSPNLRHNAPGVVAMARSPGDLNSASCQFYITLGPKSQLDQQYTIFGGVVRGMDVVNNIQIGDKIITIQVQEQN